MFYISKVIVYLKPFIELMGDFHFLHLCQLIIQVLCKNDYLMINYWSKLLRKEKKKINKVKTEIYIGINQLKIKEKNKIKFYIENQLY